MFVRIPTYVVSFRKFAEDQSEEVSVGPHFDHVRLRVPEDYVAELVKVLIFNHILEVHVEREMELDG